jgi:hypothetical protein
MVLSQQPYEGFEVQALYQHPTRSQCHSELALRLSSSIAVVLGLYSFVQLVPALRNPARERSTLHLIFSCFGRKDAATTCCS